MRISLLLGTLIFITMLGSLSRGEEVRAWTGSTGVVIQARINGIKDGMVVLEREDGRTFEVAPDKLSEADRDYARKWWSERERERESMPPSAEDPDFADWPTSVAAENIEVREVESEGSESGLFLYESEHFRFTSDVQLGVSLVKEFGRLFEGTYAAVNGVPLGLIAQQREKLFDVRLYELESDFLAALGGGMTGAAGVYDPNTDTVMVPLASLGVKKVGSRYSIEDKQGNETLIHEIAHQLTTHWSQSVRRAWWSEGCAEYFASMGYRNGRFTLTGHGKRSREYMKNLKGVWEDEFLMTDPKRLLAMTQGEWNASIDVANYASAHVLFYFFVHLDGEPNGEAMYRYLQAIKDGVEEEKALEEHLLKGRDLDQLREELAKGWRKHDLDLKF